MAKSTKPKGGTAPSPETARAAEVAHQQPAAPEAATAPDPKNRDLVEVEVVWHDGMPGPKGTTVMPGQRMHVPSAEAEAHLKAGKVILPKRGK